MKRPRHRFAVRPVLIVSLVLLLAAGKVSPAALGVDLTGVSGEMADNIRAVLSLYDLAERDDVDPYTAQFYLDRAATEVRSALEPFGYYSPEVSTRLRQDKQLTAQVRVDVGQPVRVDSVSVRLRRGGEPAGVDFLLPVFPLTPGDRLDHQRYEAGKKAIRNTLFDQGYVDSRLLTHEVRVHPEQHTADIELVWELGELHQFGEIRFEGGQFDDQFMRRFLPFDTGDDFAQNRLLELTQRLRDSGYFERVGVEPDLDRDEPVVPVTVVVTQAGRTLYEIGASYGTDSGLGLDFDAKRRWVNDRGHKASAVANLGQRRQVLAFRYEVPRGDHFESSYQLGVSLTDEETDSTESQAARISLGRLSRWRGWRRTEAISYLNERSLIGGEETHSYFVLPALTLARTESEGGPIPTRGTAWRGSIRAAAEPLLSSASLLQLDLGAKWIWSPAEDWRLISRARVGTTWTDQFDELPASLRFFAGGDRTIRGFDYESVGPRNEDGEVIGGKHLIVGSLEVERVVRGPWRAAAFVDAGNAFRRFEENIEVGAGFGVHYASPIGMIRADVGFPLTEDEQSLRLHLMVGPDL